MKGKSRWPLIITKIEYGPANEASRRKLGQVYRLLLHPVQSEERSSESKTWTMEGRATHCGQTKDDDEIKGVEP